MKADMAQETFHECWYTSFTVSNIGSYYSRVKELQRTAEEYERLKTNQYNNMHKINGGKK